MNQSPVNDAGRRQPALRHNNQSDSGMIAHPPSTAKRARAWLADRVAIADARWLDQHVQPLLRSVLRARGLTVGGDQA